MKIKIAKKTKIREKDSVEIDFITPQPLWKGDIKHKIIDCVLNNNFSPQIISSDVMEVFFDHKKGLPFSEKNLAKVMQYVVPQKSSIGDVYLNHSITLNSKKPQKYEFHFSLLGGRAKYWHNHASLSLATFNKAEIVENTKQLFSDMCLLIKPDLARVQFYTGEEHHKNSLGYGYGDIILSSNRHLMNFLPDIYAVTVFGKPYIDLFGKDKILSSPCYKVDEMTNGLIKLQLGDHVFDERGSKESLKNVRKAVKGYLNNNAFLAPELPDDYLYQVPDLSMEIQYNVPKFDLSEIRAPIELPKAENDSNVQGEGK